jgi:hydrogenase maturation protease
MNDAARGRTLVLGLGNPIMGDDGLGLAVLERLRTGWRLPPEVEIVDGGTWGMKLLPLIEDAGRVLLLDAINAEAEPGAPLELDRSALPAYFSHKLSPHQIDLREVLALAQLRGTLPPEVVAIGAQPARLELSADLSPLVAEQVDAIAELAVARLEHWGHQCTRLPEGSGP